MKTIHFLKAHGIRNRKNNVSILLQVLWFICKLESSLASSSSRVAFDRIRYKRLWPRYIADMYVLRTNHPKTWDELQAGNISSRRMTSPLYPSAQIMHVSI